MIRTLAVLMLLAATSPAQTLRELREAVRSYDTAKRTRAIDELGRRGKEATLLEGELAAALQDRDPGVRWRAAWALGRIGPKSPMTWRALIRLLDDDQAWRAAVFALGRGDRAVESPIIALLETKPRAHAVLRELLPEEAIPRLVRALSSPNGEIVSEAVYSLQQYGPAAAPAAPTLRKLLDETPDVPFVPGALGAIGEAGLPHLVDALKTAGAARSVSLCVELERQGPAVPEAAIPILLAADDRIGPTEFLQAPGLPRRLDHADRVLVAMGKKTIPYLATALHEKRSPRAIRVLGFLGAEARPAIRWLVRAIREEERLGPDAAWALGRITSPKDRETIGFLRRAVRTGLNYWSSAGRLKISAFAALQRLDATDWASREAIATVARSSRGPGVRAEALRLLAREGATDLPILEAVRERLRDSDVNVRAAALFAHCRLDPEGRRASDRLAKIFEKGDRDAQVRAARDLGELGFLDAGVQAALDGALASKYQEVRDGAVRSFLRHYPDDYEFMVRHLDPLSTRDELRGLLDNALGIAVLFAALDKPDLRRQADRALARIEPRPEQLSAIRDALGHDSRRARAAVMLGNIGAAAALDDLARHLTDPDQATRLAVTRAHDTIRGNR